MCDGYAAKNSSNDFANGVTVNKLEGLSITSYSAHQIFVEAATNQLVAAGTTDVIPISVVGLTVSASGDYPVLSFNNLSLSVNPQVLIDNPLTDYIYQNVLYNLSFSIQGNDPNILAAKFGTYTSSIIFVIVSR